MLAGELVDEPGVDGAEHGLPLLGFLLDDRDVFEQPLELDAREVGGARQARLLLEAVLPAVLVAQLLADILRTSVEPYNCFVQGLSCDLVPYESRLPLICDPDSGDV